MQAYPALIDIYETTEDKEGLSELIEKLKLIERDPDYNFTWETAEAISLLARAYRVLGDYENAIKSYNRDVDKIKIQIFR